MSTIQLRYEKCARCWHFIEPNCAYEPDDPYLKLAEYVHLDDGDKEHDHDAEPSGDLRTLDQWQHDHPELFTEYGDGAIGPNSAHFTPAHDPVTPVMRLLMVDGDGAVMQEYSGVTAQADGHEISGTVLMVRIPGESGTEQEN